MVELAEAVCSLNLRRVKWLNAYALYTLKANTGRPVCDLVNEAIEYWLDTGLSEELREVLRYAVDGDGEQAVRATE